MDVKNTFDTAELLQEFITGSSSVNIWASGASGTGSAQILSDLGANITEQTCSAVLSSLTVSSASANDTAAGTGARTVLLTGLDANWNIQSEIIALNGQTAVTTVNTYLFVQSLQVLTAGSGGTNAGIIYVGTGVVTSGVPATKYLAIQAGYGASRMGVMAVPAGYSFCMTNQFFKNNDASLSSTLVAWVKEYGGIYCLIYGGNYLAGVNSPANIRIKIPPKSLVKITGNASSGTPACSVILNGYLTGV